MKTLLFDQFEFDSVSSEQTLEINIASRTGAAVRQFRDIRHFAAASVGVELAAQMGTAQSYSDIAACSSIRAYLKRFANIDVPDPCPWKMYVLINDDLDWDGILETPDLLIRYHWWSTA